MLSIRNMTNNMKLVNQLVFWVLLSSLLLFFIMCDAYEEAKPTFPSGLRY